MTDAQRQPKIESYGAAHAMLAAALQRLVMDIERARRNSL